MPHKDNRSAETQNQKDVILVVEDDRNIGYLLTEIIEEETSYRVTLVPDGCEALKFVRTIKPCLFLIDYLLPVMDGLELYDQLHSAAEFEHTPVLFMSANPPTEELQKRDICCIKKPFDLEEIVQALERCLS
jgi:CheY-like chemotaxis protein